MTQITETEIEFSTRQIDSAGNIQATAPQRARQARLPLDASQAIDLIWIPGGPFMMGSPRGQGYPDEQPQHFVQLPAFWMSRGLVTQAQWQAVMGKLTPCRFHGPDLPVENVTWDDARRFGEKLSARAGRILRLPGEAQWEFACRAGAQTAFSFGPSIHSDLANYNGEFSYREGPKGLYRHTTTPAGSFPPNAFGLYDLHGNLWEWTADAWHADYSGAPADGSPWAGGSKEEYRVVRGGSWHDIPDVCRSAARMRLRKDEGDEMTGFRVVMEEGFTTETQRH